MADQVAKGGPHSRKMGPEHPAQGFTLIELVAVLVVLGILAAVAIPRFTSFLSSEGMHGVVVQRTADSLRTSLAIVRAEARVSENLGGCYRTDDSFAFRGGEVCMHPDMAGVPVATTGISSGHPTRSRQLWELMIKSPPLQDDDQQTNGWYETLANNCPNDTSDSFTYCWAYFVSGEKQKLLRYNDDNDGSVEVLTP